MTPTVQMWSSPTTVCTGGLQQLPALLDGRAMLLIADERLTGQVDAVLSLARSVQTLRMALSGAAEDVVAAVARHPAAVPVALGGGSVMDVVRLAALAAADPGANGFLAAADGPTFLPTRVVNPTICIPSTTGTGSEVSPVAVRQGAEGTAMIISPGLRSAAAVIDPGITGSLTTAALAVGLVEPWARVGVPAIAGDYLRFQDGLAGSLVATLLGLGDELTDRDPDDAWRTAAALASMQTHLGLLSVGRTPAGHVLWPLATEVIRATGLSKAVALAALVPAWLRCVAAGSVGRSWGTADRVRAILGDDPLPAAARLAAWVEKFALPTYLPAGTDTEAVVARVLHPWQSSGVFLPGVPRAEIATVVQAACGEG